MIGNERLGGDQSYLAVAESGLFRARRDRRVPSRAGRRPGDLLDLVLSRSHCAKLPLTDREPVFEAVGRLYDDAAGPDGVRLPYVTECYRATKKGER